MGVGGKAGIDGDQWLKCVEQRGWLWNGAPTPSSMTLILAHGAGAPMDSAWMTGMAERLAARGVSVLRFEFPYMAQRRTRGHDHGIYLSRQSLPAAGLQPSRTCSQWPCTATYRPPAQRQ